MSTVLTPRRCTSAEYLRIDEQSVDRYEFFSGEIVAMSGSTPNHDRLAGTIYSLVDNHLRGQPCETFTGNMRVKVATTDTYVYPDVSIACGAEFEKIAGVQTLLNPVAIFEVLSPSTEAKDRGRKLARYLHIATLREYFMVSQDEMRIDVIARTADGWRYTITSEPEEFLRIESIDLAVSLADIYRRIEFPPAEATEGPFDI